MINIYELIGQKVCNRCITATDQRTGKNFTYSFDDINILVQLVKANGGKGDIDTTKFIEYMDKVYKVMGTVTITSEGGQKPVTDIQELVTKPKQEKPRLEYDDIYIPTIGDCNVSRLEPRVNESFTNNSGNVHFKQQQEFINKLKNDSRLLRDQRAYMIAVGYWIENME